MIIRMRDTLRYGGTNISIVMPPMQGREQRLLTHLINKVSFHASDEAQIIGSGITKMREFMQAGYPYTVLKYCANTVANEDNMRAWNTVLKTLRKDMHI